VVGNACLQREQPKLKIGRIPVGTRPSHNIIGEAAIGLNTRSVYRNRLASGTSERTSVSAGFLPFASVAPAQAPPKKSLESVGFTRSGAWSEARPLVDFSLREYWAECAVALLDGVNYRAFKVLRIPPLEAIHRGGHR